MDRGVSRRKGLALRVTRTVEAFEQRLGVHEVRRGETFRVRVVHGRECGARLLAAVLALPEPGETHRGPQLPRSAALPPGRLDGLAEAILRGDVLVGRLGQQKFALEAIQFGLLETLLVI